MNTSPPKDIVLVPVYSRPNYLRLCLDYMSVADGIADKEVWICIDRGRSLLREFYDVMNDFRDKVNFRTVIRPEHSYYGNSFNTLESYKEAYQCEDVRFIYLIEEDVLITRDFFKWHEAVQSTGSYFCSVAYKCSRNSEARTDIVDSAAYFTSSRDYASVGVAWRREQLAPVVKHAVTEYYQDCAGYLAKHFPNNRFADSYTEQDGLIMRVLGDTHGLIVWSYTSFCHHVGFAGYHRPRGSAYSYDELKGIIYDAAKVKDADKDFGDIEPVPRDSPKEWDPAKLYCVQRFE